LHCPFPEFAQQSALSIGAEEERVFFESQGQQLRGGRELNQGDGNLPTLAPDPNPGHRDQA
jgi:hypothetical protein